MNAFTPFKPCGSFLNRVSHQHIYRMIIMFNYRELVEQNVQ